MEEKERKGERGDELARYTKQGARLERANLASSSFFPALQPVKSIPITIAPPITGFNVKLSLTLFGELCEKLNLTRRDASLGTSYSPILLSSSPHRRSPYRALSSRAFESKDKEIGEDRETRAYVDGEGYEPTWREREGAVDAGDARGNAPSSRSASFSDFPWDASAANRHPYPPPRSRGYPQLYDSG